MAEVQDLSAFIQRIHFVGDKESKDNVAAFIHQSSLCQEKVTMPTVKACFLEFEKKVTVKDFRQDDALSLQLAATVLVRLKHLLRHVVGGGGTENKEENQRMQLEACEILLQTWTAMLKAGPGLNHLKLMKDIFEKDTKQFLQLLTCQKIDSWLVQLKRDFTADGGEEDDFARCLRTSIAGVLESFTPEQYKGVQMEVLDVYVFYISRIPHSQEKVADTLRFLCGKMADKYEDRNIFLGVKSTDVMKTTVEGLKQLMFLDAFHEQKGLTQTMVSNALEKVFKAICSEQGGGRMVVEMFDWLMATFLDICRHEKCRASERAMEPFRSKIFKGLAVVPTEAMFTSCITTMTEVMALTPVGKYLEEVITASYKEVLMKYPKPSAQQSHLWLQWCLAALKTGRADLARTVQYTLDDKQLRKCKVFQWKVCYEEGRQMLDVVGVMRKAQFHCRNGRTSDLSGTIDIYSATLKVLLKQMKQAKVLPEVTTNIVQCALNCLEIDPPAKCTIASDVADEDFLELQNNQEVIPDVLRRILTLMRTEDYPWDIAAREATNKLFERCINAYSNGGQMSEECNQLFMEIFQTCLEGEDEERFFDADNPDIISVFFLVVINICKFINMHHQSSTMTLVTPIAPELLRWCNINTDNESLTSIFLTSLMCLCLFAPEELKAILPDVLHLCFDQDRSDVLLPVIPGMYQHNPEALHTVLPDLFDKLASSSEKECQMILNLFRTVSSTHPEAFSESHVGALLELSRRWAANSTDVVLVILRAVSEKEPKRLAPFIHVITDDAIFSPDSLKLRTGIISCVGHVNESLNEKTVDYLMTHVTDQNPSVSLIVLGALRSMVKGNESRFEKHKTKIEQLEKSTTHPTVAETCHGLVLAIEGKNVEGLFEDLKDQQEELGNLDARVVVAEGTVNVLGVRVEGQEHVITGVKKDVVRVERKVDDVEKDLDQTKLKVDEIDMKTMTNAPKWSRDLTKLMNPVAENDWRLLAKRLGYSNDDIRGWATQHDPCMALLSEWYAVRKTSEASRAVYTALEEMDRMDGLVIVENAMKAAEGVVEDEEFEYASPPPIFLSYQWGMQEEVKLLNKHLNMAGYQCWMDIGQMGGGDKLFAKIDDGIRAAKLVICCTTEKYAKSPNCNREVNLSVSLGKPIIPLLMEKMDWPPRGSMGPIFSEYLFIRFFQRGGEETKDQRYWPVPKFQELLMQLNFNKVMPMEENIAKEYQNWWAPDEEEIVIEKDKGKTPSTSQAPAILQTKEGDTESCPDVFLSYQWGKQPQLKELYKRLTGIGYTCWMDIYQMGGGDSLYDKIDRGMRGCKVVVSCVTPKYALSANCRREVSLADALKKPIVPLLLDQMTWPPDGPMSMVFTQLLYINFYRNQDDQMQWKSPQFKELVDQVSQHIPGTQTGGNVCSPEDKDRHRPGGEKGHITETAKSQPSPSASIDKPQLVVRHDRKAAAVSDATPVKSQNTLTPVSKANPKDPAGQPVDVMTQSSTSTAKAKSCCIL